MRASNNNLIWIDLEMTGLDPLSDVIIEIATVVTGASLEVIAEGPSLAIHQPEVVLDGMDEWNITHHGASGLIQRVRESQLTVAEAERKTLEFLTRYVPEGVSPMCGNSVCQDRRFMAKYMPQLEAYFHYRHIDVSTLKELARRWAPDILAGIEKESNHLALDDVYESIEECRYYRKHFIRT